MKKTLKIIIITLIALLLLFVLSIAAWVFIVIPNLESAESGISEPGPAMSEIAEISEKIDFNESNGVLYVNNEIVVFVRSSASEEKITALFDSFDAEIDDSMADIYVYRLVFREAMSYDELEAMVKRIKAESIVENAYLNTVTELQSDSYDSEDDFEYKEASYPNDPWNGDSWNVSVKDSSS